MLVKFFLHYQIVNLYFQLKLMLQNNLFFPQRDLKNLSLMKDGEEPVKEEYSEMTDRVEEAWNDYLSTYERLKKVWEIARYPKGGEGYMLNDQTHYMAGRTTDLSYLILAEQELDLVGHVRKLSR